MRAAPLQRVTDDKGTYRTASNARLLLTMPKRLVGAGGVGSRRPGVSHNPDFATVGLEVVRTTFGFSHCGQIISVGAASCKRLLGSRGSSLSAG